MGTLTILISRSLLRALISPPPPLYSFPMSVLFWNCQGASGKRLPSTIKALSSSHHVQILVLLEPRTSGRRADSIIRKLNFCNSFRVESIGFSGGIWVLWTRNIQLQIIHSHLQFVHMRANCPSNNLSFFLTAVYGSPQQHLRKFLWEDLPPFAPPPSSPWLIGGDFNAILSSDERRGGGLSPFPWLPPLPPFC